MPRDFAASDLLNFALTSACWIMSRSTFFDNQLINLGYNRWGIKPEIGVARTWFAGGTSRVDGVESPDRQRNSRLGGTVSIMTFNNQSLKVTYSTGATTRRGTDFDTLNVTWQLVVF